MVVPRICDEDVVWRFELVVLIVLDVDVDRAYGREEGRHLAVCRRKDISLVLEVVRILGQETVCVVSPLQSLGSGAIELRQGLMFPLVARGFDTRYWSMIEI